MNAYPETHQTGTISLENIAQNLGITINNPMTITRHGDFGIQIANDGRIWVCIDGISIHQV